MLEFQWESGNIKHVIHDSPERQNTIEKVESVFTDPNFLPTPDWVEAGANRKSRNQYAQDSPKTDQEDGSQVGRRD